MKNIQWKTYFLILVLSATGALGLLPYAAVLPSGNIPEGIPLSLMLLATFLQSFLFGALAGFFGLILSNRSGLGLPVIDECLYPGTGTRLNMKRHIVIPVLAGVVCGIVMIGADLLMIEIFNLQADTSVQAPEWWRGIFASFYGGITEEILLRLFMLNLIVFIFNSIDRRSNRKTSSTKVVLAMVISSLIFGAGHLVTAFAAGRPDIGFIARTIILNFIPGMIFGWFYWKRSFLSAMSAHFATDIVLHVVARYIIDTTAY